jgi:hypothetical protein
LKKINEIKAEGEAGRITYMLTGSTVYNWTLGMVGGHKKMNCADFATEVLQAAGAPVSSGLFNLPSAVSAPDTRSRDQIYRQASAFDIANGDAAFNNV